MLVMRLLAWALGGLAPEAAQDVRIEGPPPRIEPGLWHIEQGATTLLAGDAIGRSNRPRSGWRKQVCLAGDAEANAQALLRETFGQAPSCSPLIARFGNGTVEARQRCATGTRVRRLTIAGRQGPQRLDGRVVATGNHVAARADFTASRIGTCG